jgi:two-component system sensor histidine kinase KdpD
VSARSDRTSRFASALAAALETIAALVLATGAVGLLDRIAPTTGLAMLYLLVVLLIAIRHGELPALASAVGGVLLFNYFFIEPRHRLTIADSENVVALAVLLIAAVVVGRLASAARARAAEAEDRARQATAREREAELLAEAASSVLAGTGIESRLDRLGRSVAASTGASSART